MSHQIVPLTRRRPRSKTRVPCHRCLPGGARTESNRCRAANDGSKSILPNATQAASWQIEFDLDMPTLEPQAVQYAVLDKDPVPAYVARIKTMRDSNLRQLQQADSESNRIRLRPIQAEAAWDNGFKDVTGNNLWLLTKRPNSMHSLSSNSAPGKKWVVTKAVLDNTGKPACWCIPVKVNTGMQLSVTFNQSNKFDLQTAYDMAMKAPSGPSNAEEPK